MGRRLESAPSAYQLTPHGTRPKVTPKSAITPEIRKALVRHKSELLAALSAQREEVGGREDQAPKSTGAKSTSGTELVPSRTASFRAQLRAWAATGRCDLPILALRELSASSPPGPKFWRKGKRMEVPVDGPRALLRPGGY